MDIIDIMLARAMTPQGQTDIYVSKANAAAEKAEQAEQNAAAAIAAVEQKSSMIDAALAEAQEALANAQSADVGISVQDTTPAKVIKLTHGTAADTITKLYKSYGDNEDGTMTQKAIKAYVQANAGSGGGGSINLGPEYAGNIVVVGPDGTIIASGTSEADIIEALIKAGIYISENAIGVDIDYENKSFLRLQEAEGKEPGSDFDVYRMYGGRKRCNVADDGTITAFYGEAGYKDDGSNGQVMIYQPKFYYKRTPIKVNANIVGQKVRKETLLLSPVQTQGFKLHPLFQQGEDELEYVLLSAYEGSIVDNKLASVAGEKPVSGLNIESAENFAKQRGTGWHITNLQAESALQMLATVEFGNMNGQISLEDGVSNLSSTYGINSASITGSTADLGNATGAATVTVNESNGTSRSYTEAGYRAISYRGMENPWGNLWRLVGGVYIRGNGAAGSGVPYLCTDFDYNYSSLGNNYVDTSMNMPTTFGWINSMAYGLPEYDWIYIPAECESGANSAVPVGDSLYSMGNLSGNNVLAAGGAWSFQDKNGLFFYACDRSLLVEWYSYGARLMYIPTINSAYYSNINKWTQNIGG